MGYSVMRTIFLTILFIFISSNAFAVTIHDTYEFAAVAQTASLSGPFTTNNDNVNNSNPAPITDNSIATYLLQNSNGNASIEITSFRTDDGSTVDIYLGTGIDLSIFFLGDVYPHIFDLQLSSNGSVSELVTFNSRTHTNWTYTEMCLDMDSSNKCESESPVDVPIFVMDIDLNNDDLLNDFIAQNPINSLTMNINNVSAVPSLIGAHHLAPVPLPLPIVLFSSGLALLGFVGRRKK